MAVASPQRGPCWTTDWPGLDTGYLPDLRLEMVGAWRARPPAGGHSEWTGYHYYLGNNKEVFDAELYAIFWALSIIDQRQETGHRYTIFGDSTAAIDVTGRGLDPQDLTQRGLAE